MADDKEDLNLHGAPVDDELPVCHKCFEPYSRYDHYCKNCGVTVGQYTAYMPFVNIPFFAEFFGRLWRRTWFEKNVPWYARLFSLILVFLLAPIMLLGLPFVYFEKRHRFLLLLFASGPMVSSPS